MAWFIGILALVLVLGLHLVAFFFGRNLMYFPTESSESDFDYLVERGWERYPVETAPGITINAMRHDARLPDGDGARDSYWILFFGGNGASVVGNCLSLESGVGPTLPVGMMIGTYRGYDGSSGVPEQPGIAADSKHLAALLVENGVRPDRLILVGQSLGTGVASLLARELTDAGTPPVALILVSPFRSMAAMFDKTVWPVPVGWVCPDPWRSDDALTGVSCPKLIVHGARDRLIPASHGRWLAENRGAEYVEVKYSGHNDIWNHEETLEAVQTFLRRIVVNPAAASSEAASGASND